MRNQPAFPCVFENTGDLNVSGPTGEVVAPGCSVHVPGLTKREYFAAMAMQALIGTAAAPCIMGGLDGAEPYCAAAAVKMADALLAELDK